MTDEAITERFRVIAFDLPYHGRSNPPDRLVAREVPADHGELHRLHSRRLAGARSRSARVVIGCSMGGAIVLKLAADYQRELRGIIGLESSAFAPGRYNDFLHHPAIHGGELAATYTYGVVRAAEPRVERTRELVVLQPGRPRRLRGDVHFYSIDWDGREAIKTIDTSVCKVSLLTGEYDYSCTPDMTRQVAAAIPGARLVIMKGIGHFPMIENYPLFRDYLVPELGAPRTPSP